MSTPLRSLQINVAIHPKRMPLDPIAGMDELAKLYPDADLIHVPESNCMVILSRQVADILLTESGYLSGSWERGSGKLIMSNAGMGDTLMSQTGHSHKEHRQMVHPTFSRRNLTPKVSQYKNVVRRYLKDKAVITSDDVDAIAVEMILLSVGANIYGQEVIDTAVKMFKLARNRLVFEIIITMIVPLRTLLNKIKEPKVATELVKMADFVLKMAKTSDPNTFFGGMKKMYALQESKDDALLWMLLLMGAASTYQGLLGASIWHSLAVEVDDNYISTKYPEKTVITDLNEKWLATLFAAYGVPIPMISHLNMLDRTPTIGKEQTPIFDQFGNPFTIPANTTFNIYLQEMVRRGDIMAAFGIAVLGCLNEVGVAIQLSAQADAVAEMQKSGKLPSRAEIQALNKDKAPQFMVDKLTMIARWYGDIVIRKSTESPL